MNRSHNNQPPQRSCQRARSVRRGRTLSVVCVWLTCALVAATTVSAQNRWDRPTAAGSEAESRNQTSTISKTEQLNRALQKARAISLPNDADTLTAPPQELFLDLAANDAADSPDADSSQAMAASLDVSMTSSPTHVLMRAVSWIAIVLCVCCLIILGARHWQRQRGLLPTTTSRSKVLETLSLGPSRTVSLIEMHGYRALVASDATGIRSLVMAPSSFEETMENEFTED